MEFVSSVTQSIYVVSSGDDGLVEILPVSYDFCYCASPMTTPLSGAAKIDWRSQADAVGGLPLPLLVWQCAAAAAAAAGEEARFMAMHLPTAPDPL